MKFVRGSVENLIIAMRRNWNLILCKNKQICLHTPQLICNSKYIYYATHSTRHILNWFNLAGGPGTSGSLNFPFFPIPLLNLLTHLFQKLNIQVCWSYVYVCDRVQPELLHTMGRPQPLPTAHFPTLHHYHSTLTMVGTMYYRVFLDLHKYCLYTTYLRHYATCMEYFPVLPLTPRVLWYCNITLVTVSTEVGHRYLKFCTWHYNTTDNFKKLYRNFGRKDYRN